MKMTFEQYINNPMGIKNAVFSAREMYRNLYTEKLNTILVREVGKVKYRLYKSKKKDRYYVYMKIPSEVIANFYYDTVVEFYTDHSGIGVSKTLKDYYVKFYSNDPSFVYTFAHAMLKNDLFIKELVPRMSKQAVKQVAKEKNPKSEVGYVKSIYFTYLLMKNYGLFNKDVFENEAIDFDLKDLLNRVEHADTKVQARQDAQKELNKSKKIQKNKEREANNINRNPELSTKSTNRGKKIGIVNKISSVSKTKASKRIKKF